jgi:hypothetical protein
MSETAVIQLGFFGSATARVQKDFNCLVFCHIQFGVSNFTIAANFSPYLADLKFLGGQIDADSALYARKIY